MTTWAQRLHGWHSDSEQPLFQLQPEQLTVSYAKSSTAGLAQVRGQEGASRVPCACTAPELSHIVVTGACTHSNGEEKQYNIIIIQDLAAKHCLILLRQNFCKLWTFMSCVL